MVVLLTSAGVWEGEGGGGGFDVAMVLQLVLRCNHIIGLL